MQQGDSLLQFCSRQECEITSDFMESLWFWTVIICKHGHSLAFLPLECRILTVRAAFPSLDLLQGPTGIAVVPPLA